VGTFVGDDVESSSGGGAGNRDSLLFCPGGALEASVVVGEFLYAGLLDESSGDFFAATGHVLATFAEGFGSGVFFGFAIWLSGVGF